jgi:STAS-like domain of unknown function (DUF4325)
VTRIAVKDQLGNDVVSREHGARMRILLENALKCGDTPIVVDFAGMKITSVSFFDESFGVLAKQYGEQLLRNFKLDEIDAFDLALVHDIVSSRSREAKKKSGKAASR